MVRSSSLKLMRCMALLCAMVWFSAVHAQALPAGVSAGNSIEGIDEYVLANGMKVLLFVDASKPSTTVNITYMVGSRHENYGETGMAHLLEHLVFKGTPTHRNIPQEFAKRGMRWNGTTYLDRTNYFSSFPASDETLEFALKLEADRMVNSFIAKADLDSEMTVVRNEMERGENDPGRILMQRVLATAYLWHNYGNSTIGARSDVENVNIERLQAFYRMYYQPDNAVLTVAGNFDSAKTLAWIAHYFGALQKPSRALPILYTAEPTQDGERSVVLQRVTDQQRVTALYHIPAITHTDTPALSVFVRMMANNTSGRLYKALVETRKTANVQGFTGLFRDPGYAGFGVVVPTTGNLEAIRTELLTLIETAANTPFTQEEFERTRREMLVGFEKLMQSPEDVAILLSESIGQGDWRMLLVARERIRAATLADVQRVASQYFKSSNRTVGMLVPGNATDRVDIAKAPSAAEVANAASFGPPLAAGEKFDPSPSNLESRVQRKTLPSGIQYAALTKKNRGDTVTLLINLRWAQLEDVHERLGASFVAPLMFEGTATRNKQQIQDALINIKSTLAIQGGPQGASITLNSERGFVLQALAIAEDLLKNPVFDPAAFERLRTQRLTALQASRRELSTLLSDQQAPYLNTQRDLKPGHPRYILTSSERAQRLTALTLDDVKNFYRDFWGARQVSVAAVGGIPEGLEAALEASLSNFKRDVPQFVRYVADHKDIAAKRFEAQAADKANALLDMDSYFALTQRDAAYWPLLVANRMFGGGQLDNRLGIRVRQKDGLTYGISSRMSASYWDNRASFGINGTFAPENRERIMNAVIEEMERARRDGFTQDELDTAKSALLAAQRQARNSDGSIAANMLWQLETENTFAELAENEAKLKAVTLDAANAAFRRFVDPARLLIGTAGDFTKLANSDKKP